MIEVSITGRDFARVLTVQDGYSFEVDAQNNLYIYTVHDNCAMTVRDGFWSHVRDLDPDVAENK